MNHFNNNFKRNSVHEGTRPGSFGCTNPGSFAPQGFDSFAFSNRGNLGYFGHGNFTHSCTGNLGHSNPGNYGHSIRGNCNHSSRGNCNHLIRGNCIHSSRGNYSPKRREYNGGTSRHGNFAQWHPVHQSVMSYGVQTDLNITASRICRATRVRSFESVPLRRASCCLRSFSPPLPRRFDPAEFHRRLDELRASIIARAANNHRSLIPRSGHRLKVDAIMPVKTSTKRLQKIPRPKEEASFKDSGNKKRSTWGRMKISRNHIYASSSIRNSRIKPLSIDVRFISDIKYITKCIRDSICGPDTHVCPRLMERYMNHRQNHSGVEVSRGPSSKPVITCGGCVPPSPKDIISAIVDSWLQELPVFADFTKRDEEVRDHAKAKLKRNLNKNLKDASIWKDIITASLDCLLVWVPPDPKDQASFKENMIQDLLKRLERVSPEKIQRKSQPNAKTNDQPSSQSSDQPNAQTITQTSDQSNVQLNTQPDSLPITQPITQQIAQPSDKQTPRRISFETSNQALTHNTEKLKGDTIESIIQAWIATLNIKNEATVNKEELVDYMSKLVKNIALATDPHKLLDTVNDAINIELNILPLENTVTELDKKERTGQLATALNDFLHKRRTSIIESVDEDIIKDIKRWCCNLNFSANADVDIDMYAYEIAADVKSVFEVAPWNLWDDLNNVILDYLFSMPLQYPESCTTEARKLVNALINKLFIYKIKKWAERIPFARDDVDIPKFVKDLTKDVEYAMATNLRGDEVTPVKETILHALNKYPLTCDVKEKAALAKELALDICVLPREKDNIAFLHGIVQEWIDALASECRKPLDDDSKQLTTKDLVLSLNNVLKNTPTEEMWDAMYFAVFSKLNELPLGLNDVEREYKAETFVNALVQKIKYEEVSNWVSNLPFTNESVLDMDTFTRRLCEQLQLKKYTDNENFIYETVIKEMNKLPLQRNIKGKNELVVNLVDILGQVPEEKDVIKYSVGSWLESITLNENTPECRIWVIDRIANDIKDIFKITKPENCWFKIKTTAIKAAKEFATETSPGMFYYSGESLANMVTYNLFEDAVKTWVNVVPFQSQAKDQISQFLLDKIRNLAAVTIPAQLKEAVKIAALTELNNLHVVCSESEKETFADTLASKICSLPKERNVFLEVVRDWAKNIPFVTPPEDGLSNFVHMLSGKLIKISTGLEAENCVEAFTVTILKELISQTLKCTPEEMKELAEELGYQLTSYMFDAMILNMIRGIPLRKSPPVDKYVLAAQLATSLKRIFRDYGQANAKLPLINEVKEIFKKLPIDFDETKTEKLQQIMAETLADEIIKFGELPYPGEKFILKLLHFRPEYNSMPEKDIRNCVKRISPKYLVLLEEGLEKPELEKILKMKVDSCIIHLKEESHKLHVKVSTWLESLTNLTNEDKSSIKPEPSTHDYQRLSIKSEENDDFTQNYKRRRIKPKSNAGFIEDFHMLENAANKIHDSHSDKEISNNQLFASLKDMKDENEIQEAAEAEAVTNSASSTLIPEQPNTFENYDIYDQIKYDWNVMQTGRKSRGKWKYVDPTIKKSLTDKIFRKEVDFQILSEAAAITNEKNYSTGKYNAKTWVISKILQEVIGEDTKNKAKDKFKERTVTEIIRNLNQQEPTTSKLSPDIWCQKANDMNNEAHTIFIQKEVQHWIDTLPALNATTVAEICSNNRFKDVITKKLFDLELKTLVWKQDLETEIEEALELTLKRRNKFLDLQCKNEYAKVLIKNIIETSDILQRIETAIQNDVINWVESIPELSSTDLGLENQVAVSKISRQLTKYVLSIIVKNRGLDFKKHFYNFIHEYLQYAFIIVKEPLDSKTKHRLTNKLLTYINVRKKQLEQQNVQRFLKREIKIFLQTTRELDATQNNDIVKFDEFCRMFSKPITDILFEEINKGDLIPRMLRVIRKQIEVFLYSQGKMMTSKRITILVNRLFKVLIGKLCTTDILRTDSTIMIEKYIEKLGIEYEIEENKMDKAIQCFAKSIMRDFPELRIAMNGRHLEKIIKYLFNNGANILKEKFDMVPFEDSTITADTIIAKILNVLDEELVDMEIKLPTITKRRLAEKLCSNLFGTEEEITEQHRSYLVQQVVKDVINFLNRSQQLENTPDVFDVLETEPDTFTSLPHSTKNTIVEQLLTTVAKSTDNFEEQHQNILQFYKNEVSESIDEKPFSENDCETNRKFQYMQSKKICGYEITDPQNQKDGILNYIKRLTQAFISQRERQSSDTRTELAKKLFDAIIDCLKCHKDAINEEGDDIMHYLKELPEKETETIYSADVCKQRKTFEEIQDHFYCDFEERNHWTDKLDQTISSDKSIQNKKMSNTSQGFRKTPTRFCESPNLSPRSNSEVSNKMSMKLININERKKELLRFICGAVLKVNDLDEKMKHGLVEHLIEELSKSSKKDCKDIRNGTMTYIPCHYTHDLLLLREQQPSTSKDKKCYNKITTAKDVTKQKQNTTTLQTIFKDNPKLRKNRNTSSSGLVQVSRPIPAQVKQTIVKLIVKNKDQLEIPRGHQKIKKEITKLLVIKAGLLEPEAFAFTEEILEQARLKIIYSSKKKTRAEERMDILLMLQERGDLDAEEAEALVAKLEKIDSNEWNLGGLTWFSDTRYWNDDINIKKLLQFSDSKCINIIEYDEDTAENSHPQKQFNRLLAELAEKVDKLQSTLVGHNKVSDSIEDSLQVIYSDLDEEEIPKMESELYRTIRNSEDPAKALQNKAKDWTEELPSHTKRIGGEQKWKQLLEEITQKETPRGETKIRINTKDQLNEVHSNFEGDDIARMESKQYQILEEDSKNLTKSPLNRVKEWTKTLPVYIKPIVNEKKKDEIFEYLAEKVGKLKNIPGGDIKLRQNIRNKLNEIYGDLDEDDMEKMESELYHSLVGDVDYPGRESFSKAKYWENALPSHIKPIVGEQKMNKLLGDLFQKTDKLKNTPGGETKIRQNIRNKLNAMYGDLDEVDMARMESQIYHTVVADSEEPAKASLNKANELAKHLPLHIKPIVSEVIRKQLLEDLAQKADKLINTPGGETKIRKNIRNKLNEMYSDLDEEDMAIMESELYHTLVGDDKLVENKADYKYNAKALLNKAKEWTKDLPPYIKPVVGEQKMNELLGDLAQNAHKLQNTPGGETRIRKNIRNKLNAMYGDLAEDDMARMESELYNSLLGDGEYPAKESLSKAKDWAKALPSHIKPIVSKQKMNKLLGDLAEEANELKNTPGANIKIRKNIRDKVNEIYGDLDEDDKERMESELYHILGGDGENPALPNTVKEWTETMPLHIKPIVGEQKRDKLLENLAQKANALKNTTGGEHEIRKHIRENLKETYGDLHDDDMTRMESEMYHILVKDSKIPTKESLKKVEELSKILPSDIEPIVGEQKKNKLLEDLVQTADKLKNSKGGARELRKNIRNNLKEIYGDLEDDDIDRMESELYYNLVGEDEHHVDVSLNQAKNWTKNLPSHIKPIVVGQKINQLLEELAHKADVLKDTIGGETKIRKNIRANLAEMYGELDEDDMARMESELYHTLTLADEDSTKDPLDKAKEWMKLLPPYMKPIASDIKINNILEDLSEKANELKGTLGGETELRITVRGKLNEIYGDLDEDDMARMESELYHTLVGNSKNHVKASLNNAKEWTKALPSNIKPIVGEQKRDQLLEYLVQKAGKLKNTPGGDTKIRKNIRNKLTEMYGELDENDLANMESDLYHTLFEEGEVESLTTKTSLNKAKDWTKDFPSHIKPIVSELQMNKIIEDLAQKTNALKHTPRGEIKIRKNIREKLNEMYGDLDEDDIARMESKLYHNLVKDSKESENNINELIQTLPSHIKPIIGEPEMNRLFEDLVQKADKLGEKEIRKSIRNNLKEIYGDLDDDDMNRIESDLYRTLMNNNNHPNNKLSKFIEDWTSDLPIQGDSEEVTTIKENLADEINKTIAEINGDSNVFNDTELYKDTLKTKIDNLLSKLDYIPPDFKAKLPNLRDDLIKNILDTRQQIMENKATKTEKCPCFLQKDKGCQCFANQTDRYKPCVNKKQESCVTRHACCMTPRSNECFTQTPTNSSCQTISFRRRTVPSLLCRSTYASSNDSLEEIPHDSRTTYCQVPESQRSRASQYFASDARKCNRNRYCGNMIPSTFTDDEENHNWCNISCGFGKMRGNRPQEHFRSYRPGYCTQKPHNCNGRRMRY